LRLDLKAPLQKLVELNHGREGNDQDLNFARGLESFTHAHTGELQQLSKSASRAIDRGHVCLLLLESLHFTQIRDRKLQIGARSAHPNTFTWIFEKNPEGEHQGQNFAEWLQAEESSSSIFWVAGRPGTGKSTLMHFLSLAPETKDGLRYWAKDKPLLQGASFFWLSGTALQKSLSGLLRSLLYDLLNQDLKLVEKIAPIRWRAQLLGIEKVAPWSNGDMLEALHDLVTATATTHRIFILVDGLDEFDGSFQEQTELVTLLKTLADRPNIKVCVASRPEPIFESAFANCPQFRLENLTRNDIDLYVNEKFAAVNEFEDLRLLYPEECTALVLDIGDRAQGVFLWVYLVVASLIQGMTEGDSIVALQTRLEEIPDDLQKYFRQMIDSIPLQHRPLAAAYFSILTTVEDLVITLLSLSYLEEATPDFLEHCCVEPAPRTLVEARKRSMARRLASRCKGLIQVNKVPSSVSGSFSDHHVDFLHRTVRDFLLLRDIQTVLEQYSSTSLNPYLFLCQSMVAQLKIASPGDEDVQMSTLAGFYIGYVSRLEDQPNSESSSVRLTDLFFELLHHLTLNNLKERDQYGSDGSILRATLAYGLSKYSLQKIESSKVNVNKLYFVHPNLAGDLKTERLSLLGQCIEPRGKRRPTVEVIEALFAKGADPNLKQDDLTPWETLLRVAHDRTGTRDRRTSQALDAFFFRAAQLFIDYGASATGKDPRHPPEWRERAAAGKKYRYNVAPQDLVDAVKHIFGPTLAQRLRDRSSVTGRFRKLFTS
jgi:hypothetical protein